MNRPAPVELSYKNMRFLITHNPTNSTLGTFIEVRSQTCTHTQSQYYIFPSSLVQLFHIGTGCVIQLCRHLSIQDLKKYGATTVVRVCEVTYDKTPLENDGITVMVSH